MTMYFRDETRNGFSILAPDDLDKDWQVIKGTALHDNDPVFEGSQAECQAYIDRQAPLKKFRVYLTRRIQEEKTLDILAVDEAAVTAQLAHLYAIDEGDGWEPNELSDIEEGEHTIEDGADIFTDPDWIIDANGRLHQPEDTEEVADE